jgi:hypothetical protein
LLLVLAEQANEDRGLRPEPPWRHLLLTGLVTGQAALVSAHYSDF